TGGFQSSDFTPALYHTLHQYCAFIAHTNRERFWQHYFAHEVAYLRAFLAQFGGHHRSVEFGTTAWLDGPAADLKAALCAEMRLLYDPLGQVVDDLEQQHAALVRVWHDFAQAAELAPLDLPSGYVISANSRSLLAFAGQIARQSRPPLAGLQQYFPPPWLELTAPATADPF
ncbi:MAG: hypothetical protein KDF65_14690, partial [Anaerolineae bacterium]|nr:hypothetical protein [Anaerolineae bacterium]